MLRQQTRLLGTLQLCLEQAKGRKIDELPRLPWSYQTTICAITSSTPISPIHDTTYVLPTEMSETTLLINGETHSLDKSRRHEKSSVNSSWIISATCGMLLQHT